MTSPMSSIVTFGCLIMSGSTSVESDDQRSDCPTHRVDHQRSGEKSIPKTVLGDILVLR